MHSRRSNCIRFADEGARSVPDVAGRVDAKKRYKVETRFDTAQRREQILRIDESTVTYQKTCPKMFGR
jgi:hypothetical protein